MDALLWGGIFIVSLGVLVKGSDWFIDAAEAIGVALGIPSFIIGVTIVAIGTSLPELASSIVAVYSGETQIVIGNAIGSNIANIALVLGLTAVIGNRVRFEVNLMQADIPLLITSAFLLYFFITPDASGISSISMFEAILLIVSLVVFIGYTFSSDEDSDEPKAPQQKIAIKTYGLLLLGGVMVYFGASYTIEAVIKISAMFNINSGAIAVSIVALGTSLPEIVVSITAMRNGKPDIAIGNILGSNVFNTFAVVGIPGVLANVNGNGLIVPNEMVSFAMPVMIAMTLLFFFMMISKSISRWEGLMLLIFYIYFIASLF